jgi:hypothetical protein
MHVIQMFVDAVTSLNDEIYVLHRPSRQLLDVYDANTKVFKGKLHVKNFSEDTISRADSRRVPMTTVCTFATLSGGSFTDLTSEKFRNDRWSSRRCGQRKLERGRPCDVSVSEFGT